MKLKHSANKFRCPDSRNHMTYIDRIRNTRISEIKASLVLYLRTKTRSWCFRTIQNTVILLAIFMIVFLLFKTYVAPPWISAYVFSVDSVHTFCCTHILGVKALAVFTGAERSLLCGWVSWRCNHRCRTGIVGQFVLPGYVRAPFPGMQE